MSTLVDRIPLYIEIHHNGTRYVGTCPHMDVTAEADTEKECFQKTVEAAWLYTKNYPFKKFDVSK